VIIPILPLHRGKYGEKNDNGTGILQVILFSPVSLIPSTLHTSTSLICHRRCIILANEKFDKILHFFFYYSTSYNACCWTPVFYDRNFREFGNWEE